MSDDRAMIQVLAAVRDHMLKMSNPKHPAYKLTIERTQFGLDENRIPQICEFTLRVEYVSLVAQLPTQETSGLIVPASQRPNESTHKEIEITPVGD